VRDNVGLHVAGTILLAIGFMLTAFGSWFTSWTTVGARFGAGFILVVGVPTGIAGLVVVTTTAIAGGVAAAKDRRTATQRR
jgi:hypothetical protein